MAASDSPSPTIEDAPPEFLLPSRAVCDGDLIRGAELALACSDVTRTFHELNHEVKVNDVALVRVAKARHKRSVDEMMSVLENTAAVPPGKRAMHKFCADVVTATSLFTKARNLDKWRARWDRATLKSKKTENCWCCEHAYLNPESLMGKRVYEATLTSPFKKIVCTRCYTEKEATKRRFFVEEDLLSEILVQYNVFAPKSLRAKCFDYHIKTAARASMEYFWIKLGDAVGNVRCSTCAEQAAYVFFESRNLACEACFNKLCAEFYHA